MAILTTTPRLHPAFGNTPVTTDTPTLTVVEDTSTAESPGAPASVTLNRVPAADGTRKYDLSGFLKTLFYDGRAVKSGTTMFYDDFSLMRRYTITGETDSEGAQVVHTAMNAVGQIDGSGSVYDVIDSGRVLRTYRPDRVLPAYEGFPVGVTITRSKSYDLDWDSAVVLRLLPVITTGSSMVAVFMSIQGGIIDWGDGSAIQFIDRPVAGEIQHACAPGIYTVKILAQAAEFNYFQATTLSRNSLYAVDVSQLWARWTSFLRCSKLITIPTGLFDGEPGRILFNNVFDGCAALTAIPTGLFDNNPLVTTFAYAFGECEALTSIPAGLFDNNPGVTDFSGVFTGCIRLNSIPTGLFDNNPSVTTFTSAFSSCTALTSIPAGLFDNNPVVVLFSALFRFCSGITAIPTGLFDNNPVVTTFTSAFSACEALTSIPAGLFDNNPLVTYFNNVFQVCHSITAIPTGLFDNNPLVTTFAAAFSGCTGIETIPAGLFDNNPLVTTFMQTFEQCANLIAIPDGTFAANKKVTNFNLCFSRVPSPGPINGTSPVTSEGYKMWERAGKPGYPATVQGRYCFRGQVGLSDYADAAAAGWT